MCEDGVCADKCIDVTGESVDRGQCCKRGSLDVRARQDQPKTGRSQAIKQAEAYTPKRHR